MPRKPKGVGPTAPRPGFTAISRLVGREPLLGDAARVEAEVGVLCLRLAERSGGPDAQAWRPAARLSARLAEGLADLAAAVADPPHHPRPTRVRVSTLQRADLDAATDALAAARTALEAPDAPLPAPDALAALWALERRAAAAPLARLFALCPVPPVLALWRTLAARRRLLETPGPGEPAGNGGAWPEPPPPPERPVAWGARANGNGNAAPGPEWTAAGCVERLDPARRCGTARTDDGRAVFFAGRAVSGGFGALHAGDPVTLRLRRGPLGVAAVRVTPGAPEAPPPPA
jgi:cold shock CspA family protein